MGRFEGFGSYSELGNNPEGLKEELNEGLIEPDMLDSIVENLAEKYLRFGKDSMMFEVFLETALENFKKRGKTVSKSLLNTLIENKANGIGKSDEMKPNRLETTEELDKEAKEIHDIIAKLDEEINVENEKQREVERLKQEEANKERIDESIRKLSSFRGNPEEYKTLMDEELDNLYSKGIRISDEELQREIAASSLGTNIPSAEEIDKAFDILEKSDTAPLPSDVIKDEIEAVEEMPAILEQPVVENFEELNSHIQPAPLPSDVIKDETEAIEEMPTVLEQPIIENFEELSNSIEPTPLPSDVIKDEVEVVEEMPEVLEQPIIENFEELNNSIEPTPLPSDVIKDEIEAIEEMPEVLEQPIIEKIEELNTSIEPTPLPSNVVEDTEKLKELYMAGKENIFLENKDKWKNFVKTFANIEGISTIVDLIDKLENGMSPLKVKEYYDSLDIPDSLKSYISKAVFDFSKLGPFFYKEALEEKNLTPEMLDKIQENMKFKQREAERAKIKEQKKVENHKRHEYLENRYANINKRANNPNATPRNEERIENYNDINNIVNLHECMYMGVAAGLSQENAMLGITEYIQTGSLEKIDPSMQEVAVSVDRGDYIISMIDHAYISFLSKDEFAKKYPKYIEARKPMFDFIEASLKKDGEFKPEEFMSEILGNPELLSHFINANTPQYLDRESEDYKVIHDVVTAKRKENNPEFEKINSLLGGLDKIELTPEIINRLSSMGMNIDLEQERGKSL